jgi:hypothetical protein
VNTAPQQNAPAAGPTTARSQAAYPRPVKRRLEIIAALLLSITTIATAWSAYQSSRWGGHMSILLNEAGAARTQESQQLALANSQTAIDVGVFLQYAEAIADENESLADFLHARFRPEMKVAVDAWLATEPLQNPEAPSTPFDMPEYSLAASVEAARLNALAEEKGAAARAANQQGDDYTLLTIMFASTLFFAGISTKFQSLRIATFLLILGWLLFLLAILIMLGYGVY